MTTAVEPAATAPVTRQPGNAYSIFILVLTVMSLVTMVLLWLPFSAATAGLLRFYDNTVCVIFLIDFCLALRRAPSKQRYFLRERGWLDLLGSIPTLPGIDAVGLLRLARLSRLARITRLLRDQNQKQLVDDVVRNRAKYAAFITVLLGFLVLTTASIVVLATESRSPGANITTGWDAFWWAFVTITTVGYGDRYPVTVPGRIAAMFVMVMGIGIIGSLASIMASLLVSPAEDEGEPAGDTGAGGEPAFSRAVEQELASLGGELAGVKDELTALRRVVERLEGRLSLVDPNGPVEPSAALAARRPGAPGVE